MMTDGMRILIAEDDEPTRQILAHRVSHWGFVPVEAADGVEALRLLALEDAPRIVLLDWILPGRDGLEVCRELDRRHAARRVYRIMLTIRNTQEDMIEALEGGADDCLPKPVSPPLLRSRLNVARRFVEMDDKVEEKARELRQLASEMAAQYVFQKTLLDTIPVPVFSKDASGLYTGCNRAFCRIAGREEHEIVGRTLFDLAPQDLAERYSAMDRELLEKGGTQKYEAPVRFADGTLHDMIFHKAVFSDPEGGARGIVGAMLDVTESNELARELARLATTDPLTGVMNRRHFIELAEKELARIKRYGGEASLLMLDLDHFKRINDTHGHTVGDEALKAVCNTCLGALREGDLLGRFGGEEFAILLPQTPLLRGVEVAERLRKLLAERAVQANDTTLHLTASFGVAALLQEDKGIDAIIERADLALYKAKENGRNRVEVGAVLRP